MNKGNVGKFIYGWPLSTTMLQGAVQRDLAPSAFALMKESLKCLTAEAEAEAVLRLPP